MYRYTRNNPLNERGYTLVESLLQLVTFFVFAQLFLLITLWTQQFQASVFSKEQTEWELFVNDLSQYLSGASAVRIMNSGQGIQVYRDDKVVDIERYQQMIRKQVQELGHEPMLLNIQSAQFIAKSSTVLVKVQFKNGLKKEREFYISLL